MSSIANLSSATSAFPPVNIHSHGHKRGSHAESTDGANSDTRHRRDCVDSGCKWHDVKSVCQRRALQNYLNNLSHNPQTNGPQSPKLAGTNVSVNA
jgi:hypothetical protein